MRALLAFDLSSLPGGSVIWNAELRVCSRTPDSQSADRMLALDLYDVTEPFIASQSSWLEAADGTPWGQSGGSPGSRLSRLSASTKAAAGTWHTFSSGGAFVAAAQAAFDSGQPLRLNLVAPAQELLSDRAFVPLNACETTMADLRPELVVEYGDAPKVDQVRNSEHFIPVMSLGAGEFWTVSSGDPVVIQLTIPAEPNPDGFMIGVNSEEWYHPAASGSDKLRFRYKVLALDGAGVTIVAKGYRRLSGQEDYWRKAVALTSTTAGFVDFVLEPGAPDTQFVAGAENDPVWSDMNYANITVTGPSGAALTIQIEAPQILSETDSVIASLWSADRTVLDAAPFHRLPQFYTQSLDNTGVDDDLSPGRGLFLVGRGANILESDMGRSALLGLKSEVGEFGLAANVAFPALSRGQSWIEDNLDGVVYQQGGAYGLSEYISKAGAWLTSPSGESRNLTPGLNGMVGAMKHFDLCSSDVWNAFDLLLNRIGATRVKEFQLIETYWPYDGGIWGQGDREIANLIASLRGDDVAADRPVFRRNGVDVRIGFWDYFEARHGFRWSASDLGYASDWSDFRPPLVVGPGVIAQSDTLQRKRYWLMCSLTAYQVIKFYQHVGWSAFERDGKGIKLSVIPNKENYNNSFDILAYQSGRYPHVVGFEFFGNPAFFSAYETGPVWSRMFSRRDGTGSPKEQRMILETSVTGLGNGEPYWDPEVAYAVTYDLMASQQADSLENDWLNWVDADVGVDPLVTKRYQDFAAKALAFSDARTDQACRPLPGETGSEGFYGILATRDLNMVRASAFATQYQLEQSVRQLHYPMLKFDLSQVRDLGNYDRVPDILVDDLAYHLPADITWLENWLKGSPSRVLVAHGFSLAKKPDGANYSENWPEFVGMNAGSQSSTLLGSSIGFTGFPTFSATAVVASGDWANDPLFSNLALSGTIASYNYATPSMVLLSAGGYPLVTKRRIYNTQGEPMGLIYYLHFRPGNSAVTGTLEKRIMEKILVTRMKRDFLPVAESISDYQLHRFRTVHGLAVAAYHPVSLAAFAFEYDTTVEQLLPFEDAAATGSFKVRLPSDMPISGNDTVYCVDMQTGDLVEETVSWVGNSAYVTLAFGGYSCRLWQIVGTDAASAVALADRVAYYVP
jgi:hypothetical protein